MLVSRVALGKCKVRSECVMSEGVKCEGVKDDE